jgi:long-chain acyl-CoA synthetase
MQGYYRSPESTRDVLSDDGWFSTGDVGYLDKDNYLFITDRKKDLLKTAAGKFVAPQPIENSLKTSPYILNAMVLGDQRRYIVALIVLNLVTVSAKLAEEGLTLSNNAALAAHPRTRELIENEVQRLTTHLAQYESIKRFALLAEDFSFDNGSLTFTMKLKRRVVETRFHSLIDSLYSDSAEPRPVTHG